MEETLASVSAPPSSLVMLVGIVVALLIFSSYTSYKAQMERTKFGFNIFVLFLPFLLTIVAYCLITYRNFRVRTKAAVADKAAEGGGASPWGVALFLGLLLVLVSYQSSVQSKWWPHYWVHDPAVLLVKNELVVWIVWKYARE
ncbi:uncharacterized protein LOC125479127 [Pyrus x bretschneideri]|uniref:uncharacterized protein LOC125479127 n=1 Tax=Pyrus x bretschneideri TaxID=225117 RepID=UPI00202DDCE0|nr:uncharacterized protein LOC125479127 [Pyrus x bretschneideri]